MALAAFFFKQNGGDKYLDDKSKASDKLSVVGFGLAGFMIGLGGFLSKGCLIGHGVFKNFNY
jgi:hypothetical protein